MWFVLFLIIQQEIFLNERKKIRFCDVIPSTMVTGLTKLVCTKWRASGRFVHTIDILRESILDSNSCSISDSSGAATGWGRGKGLTKSKKVFKPRNMGYFENRLKSYDYNRLIIGYPEIFLYDFYLDLNGGTLNTDIFLRSGSKNYATKLTSSWIHKKATPYKWIQSNRCL